MWRIFLNSNVLHLMFWYADHVWMFFIITCTCVSNLSVFAIHTFHCFGLLHMIAYVISRFTVRSISSLFVFGHFASHPVNQGNHFSVTKCRNCCHRFRERFVLTLSHPKPDRSQLAPFLSVAIGTVNALAVCSAFVTLQITFWLYIALFGHNDSRWNHCDKKRYRQPKG